MGEERVTNEKIIGKKYGRWTVLSVAKTGKHIYLNCRCDCGTERVVNREGLLKGTSKSCGCLHSDIMRNLKPNTKHGHSKTKLYAVWKTMRQRCKAKSGINYKHYSSKGVQVCPEWENFETFYSWAMSNGYQDGLEIDRKDVEGNYCPENCRWVTHMINADNRRSVFHYEYEGKTYNAKELSLLFGYCNDYISCNLRQGKSIKKIREGKIIWQKKT
jgi:hypothetical protein